MIRVPNIKLKCGEDGGKAPLLAALKILGLKEADALSWRLSRRSIDARDKGDIRVVCAVDLAIRGDENALLSKLKPGTASIAPEIPPLSPPKVQMPSRPVIAGFGPCGMFAALALARAGVRPIVLERGQRVEERAKSVQTLMEKGTLDPESNFQFGEGGAGAFSDGKLNTGVSDPRCAQILREFVLHGAPEEILYDARPHVGTDRLPAVVASIREEILSLGGEILFGAKLTGVRAQSGELCAVVYEKDGEIKEIPADTLFLALGHSADDTLRALHAQGLAMEAKPFSVGVRVEHPQSLIDMAQYGKFAGRPSLGPAEYRLSCKLPDGRGAYTFCMCPGGSVVPAASAPGCVCVNGMSPYLRDGNNANAALLTDVRPADFGGDENPLAGYAFQRALEEKAYRMGGGGFRAPAQRAEDFMAGRETRGFHTILPTYKPGVTPADLSALLPDFAVKGLRAALTIFDRQLRGFLAPDAVLTGVETRSSSPARVKRDETLQSSLRGVYPLGEGAGFAGGIMSAARDGLRAAQALIERYQ